MIPEAARELVGGWTVAARAAVAPYADVLRIVFAIAVLVAVGLAVWRVTSWRAGYLEREAAVASRDAALEELQGYKAASSAAAIAYTDALRTAQEVDARNRQIAEDHEHALQTRLASADATGRGLAERLRQYQVRRCGSAVPAAAGAPAEPPGAAGEPADGDEVDRRTAEHLAACSRDAERLAGWQRWWGQVRAELPTATGDHQPATPSG